MYDPGGQVAVAAKPRRRSGSTLPTRRPGLRWLLVLLPDCLAIAQLRLAASAAPTPSPAGVGPRQTLADQRVADVASIHRCVAQFAAVDVFVAVDARQADGAAIEQLHQPRRRLFAQRLVEC